MLKVKIKTQKQFNKPLRLCASAFNFFFLLLFFFSAPSFSQQIKVDEDVLLKNLKQHITTLASDKFEGRETGTNGEKLSYEYIISEFKKIGLEPKGTEEYLQSFTFNAGSTLGVDNKLLLNGLDFKPGEDYYPLPISNASVKIKGDVVNIGSGLVAPTFERDDYKDKTNLSGKIFLMDFATPEGDNPHSKWAEFADTRKRVDDAIAKGATGIIFYNSNKDIDDPKKETENKINPATIPVIFAKGKPAKTLLDATQVKVELVVDVKKKTRTGHNILGYINNNAANTVVIGAHYDHLGFGDSHSLHRGEAAIHNGADDNASGIAALIELARTIKKSNLTKKNYLFMAFSGEEKGLLGSNFFVKNPTIKLTDVNYMLNMDMVGRLKPDEQVLLINGAGTSPTWNEVLKNIQIDSMKIKTTESGVGPSDHTSFYLENIPVLHFFSGTHSDYHKPSDDENLINYKGASQIFRFMMELISQLNDKPKLAFTKTNDSNNDDAPRFKVTLGVVPDYAFEGAGMRIDGVTDGKPGSKAGLQKGDVVIQLGDVKVVDMMSYMKALSKFKKGETTKVKVQRGKEEKEADITF